MDSYLQTLLLHKEHPNLIQNAVAQNFSPGFSFSTHFHSTAELILCTKGQLLFHIYDNLVEVKENEYLIIYPNTPHSCATNQQDCNILQIHFYTDSFCALFPDSLKDNSLYFLLDLEMQRIAFFKEKINPQLFHCVFFLKQELTEKSSNYLKMSDLYLTQLIILLSRQVYHDCSRFTFFQNRHLLLALTYIQNHYSEKISLENISLECGISCRQLSKLFKQYLNISFASYLVYFRLSKAVELMSAHKGNYPLSHVALDTGFSSLAHFSRAFKERFGVPPAEYFHCWKK